jgi:hypothetical protein
MPALNHVHAAGHPTRAVGYQQQGGYGVPVRTTSHPQRQRAPLGAAPSLQLAACGRKHRSPHMLSHDKMSAGQHVSECQDTQFLVPQLSSPFPCGRQA